MFQARHPIDDNREDSALEQQHREIRHDLSQGKRSRVVHSKALVFDQDRTALKGFSDLRHGNDAVVQKREEYSATLGEETCGSVWRVVEARTSDQRHHT